MDECDTCTVGQITFTPGNLDDGTETPTSDGPTADGDGCLTLTLICPATGRGDVFMQFNGNEGGPLIPIGTEVTAEVECVDGNWVYAPEGVESRIITEVNCVAV